MGTVVYQFHTVKLKNHSTSIASNENLLFSTISAAENMFTLVFLRKVKIVPGYHWYINVSAAHLQELFGRSVHLTTFC